MGILKKDKKVNSQEELQKKIEQDAVSFNAEYEAWKEQMVAKYGMMIVPVIQASENGIFARLSVKKVAYEKPTENNKE